MLRPDRREPRSPGPVAPPTSVRPRILSQSGGQFQTSGAFAVVNRKMWGHRVYFGVGKVPDDTVHDSGVPQRFTHHLSLGRRAPTPHCQRARVPLRCSWRRCPSRPGARETANWVRHSAPPRPYMQRS